MQPMTLALAIALASTTPTPAGQAVHYTLNAALDPPSHTITVDGSFRDATGRDTPIRATRTIDHPISREGPDTARGFAETEGTIQLDGVFLPGASGWYGKPGDELLTFDLTVTLPAGWDAMSQGRREILERSATRTRLRFVADTPQEEIWLVAGPLSETRRMTDGVEALALLRERDDGLAAKYLDATGPYVAMYSKLLGPYPYSKFALVENFWETGYGMPSFTLLGSKVIRLPFILTSSYPHEILHNWWGNGVYVARESGNWSEGLTAYLADHLFAEQSGRGAAYRQEALQKYADYASRAKDFPLAEFRERHSPASEAVGYGKALLLFHMLRRELGDDVFVKGLRTLYAERKFQRASFDDVRSALEQASGRDLAASFTPWVTRAGAPRLSTRDVASRQDDDKSWHISGRIDQNQDGAPYPLSIPISVTMEGHETAFQTVIRATETATTFNLAVPARPLRLDVDPEFDLFRLLDPAEMPPALSGAFGADVCTMILPSLASAELLSSYRAMAVEWNKGRTAPMAVVTDAEIEALPKRGSIWIVGYENRFLDRVRLALDAYVAGPEKQGDRAVALCAWRPATAGSVMAFVAASRAVQVPGLARKLPHYHKYSHVEFEGDEPVNVDKGRWPTPDSPMIWLFTDDSPMALLSPREALIAGPPKPSGRRMLETVSALAAPEMKGRGWGTPEIDLAAKTIAAAMTQAGLEVLRTDRKANNVVGVLRGTKPEWAGESVVVGAHYDHLGTSADGKIHPGADDNASGVAVLLELARVMASGERPSRTVIFAAFTGEESGLIGSKRYVAARSPWPAKKAIGMVNLDTVGRLFKGKILVLGADSADEWAPIVTGAGYVAGAPVQPVANDPGGSDQKSFIGIGVPAVQLFTGANADYHGPGDTADRIDGEGLMSVAGVAREIVAYLAERDKPLTSKLGRGAPASAPSAAVKRRVSLGTIPDYAFPGPGVRITGTMPGSPAENAGLKEGDVIVKIGDTAIGSMQEFSDALNAMAAGVKVRMGLVRDGAPVSVDVQVVER